MPLDPASLTRAAMIAHLDAPDPAPHSAEGPHGIGWGPYLALAGGAAADLGTTFDALHRGAQEGNPLMASMGPAGMVAMKLATTLPMAILMRTEAQRHPTLATWLGYGTGAALGGVAAHNLTVGR